MLWLVLLWTYLIPRGFGLGAGAVRVEDVPRTGRVGLEGRYTRFRVSAVLVLYLVFDT